jgi:hypothetical protein
MTLVGAMVCADRVLLAADSKAVDAYGGAHRTVEKAWAGGRLAWGLIGSSVRGKEFSRWLTHHVTEYGNWQEFANHAAPVLWDINKPWTELGPYVATRDCAQVLVAGYVGDGAGIMILAWNGQAAYLANHDYLFSGAPGAEGTALRTMAILEHRERVISESELIPSPQILRVCMEIAGDQNGDECGPPYKCITLRPDGTRSEETWP